MIADPARGQTVNREVEKPYEITYTYLYHTPKMRLKLYGVPGKLAKNVDIYIHAHLMRDLALNPFGITNSVLLLV